MKSKHKHQVSALQSSQHTSPMGWDVEGCPQPFCSPRLGSTACGLWDFALSSPAHSPERRATVDQYEITITTTQLSKKLALILLQANVISLQPLMFTSQKYLLLIWGSK